ncbi:hypothetical protein BC834DRAFT_884865 [Gloeopeniophorella convolvens]|nr:hypothetical protein BC834DRAFT_884865 [Gloeopeniophorella convolvens]
MSKLEESLINRLTPRLEVRRDAHEMLRTVHARTGPGKGYDVGEGKTGVPAICAYLASKNAGYSEITSEIAQKASCLAPKTFQSTMRTVKAVLLASKASESSVKHQIGRSSRVEAWLQQAQETLLSLPKFKHDFSARLTASSVEVRTAVFFWVCQVIKIPKAKYSSVQKSYGASSKMFNLLLELLEEGCTDVKQSITDTIQELRKGKGGKPARDPSQAATTPSQSRPASPTKSALRNASLTPSVASSSKRRVMFEPLPPKVGGNASNDDDDDDGIFVHETPSKRPRTTPRASAARVLPVRKFNSASSGSEDTEMPDAPLLVASEPVAGPSTPRRPKPAPTHAYRTPPSQRIQALSLLSDDDGGLETPEAAPEAEEVEDDTLPPSRRFRPVFLDRVQWAQRAPRLAQDRAAAERLAKELMERWGHPFEALRVAAAGVATG